MTPLDPGMPESMVEQPLRPQVGGAGDGVLPRARNALGEFINTPARRITMGTLLAVAGIIALLAFLKLFFGKN